MVIVFYITNHGYGHASRNVPIIKKLLENNATNKVLIKSDSIRCNFLQRNLTEYKTKIEYKFDCRDIGIILKKGTMVPDVEAIESAIETDLKNWDRYVERECFFLKENGVDIVVTDIIPWAILAANILRIPCVLIGNFSWAQNYQSIGLPKQLWLPYKECYEKANKAIWYELHEKELENYCDDTKLVSLISRQINFREVTKIKKQYKQPIVFVSMGASAYVEGAVDVSSLPFDFLFTRGISFIGKNAHELPTDMINTPDYIAASEYVIAKGGWSTVAEILLQKKPAGMLFRECLKEDEITKEILAARGHCIIVKEADLKDFSLIIDRLIHLKNSKTCSYSIYSNDVERICKEIVGVKYYD